MLVGTDSLRPHGVVIDVNERQNWLTIKYDTCHFCRAMDRDEMRDTRAGALFPDGVPSSDPEEVLTEEPLALTREPVRLPPKSCTSWRLWCPGTPQSVKLSA